MDRSYPVRVLSVVALSLMIAACSEPIGTAENASDTCGLNAPQIGNFVTIPSGSFIKGNAPLYPEEAPSLRLQVASFRIQIHEVTRAQFADFVEESGYVTDAEQSLIDGRADAGSAVFTHPASDGPIDQAWALDPEANWRHHPMGAQGDQHPVVHVSKRDAEAYAAWAGGRLPSEIEWEYAANLGLPDPDTPTSGAYRDEVPIANTWQGVFPVVDLGSDGFQGAAPVGCFAPDKIGLHDMIGNVWEWTDTPFGEGTHTLKGGSYLCANNFCRRYRPAARHPQETDFSSNHIGFRIVMDVLE